MYNKRVLLFYPNLPFGFNNSGGSSVLTSRIYSLCKIFKEVILVRLLSNAETYKDDNYNFKNDLLYFDDDNKIKFEKIIRNEIVIDLKNELLVKKRNLITEYIRFIQPELELNSIINVQNKTIIEKALQKISPDLIICEHLMPATLINYCNPKTPWMYCHHDWLFKLSYFKKNYKNLKWYYRHYLSKKAEINIVKKSSGIISLSEFELNEIKNYNKNCVVQQVTYPPFKQDIDNDSEVSLVHLGGLNATANRFGLESFFEKVWNIIKLKNPQLKIKIIGNTDLALKKTQEAIKHDNNVIAYGHCDDLSLVLKPRDIHIIPWEFPTGSRTRIPVALYFGQVILTTKNSVVGFAELVSEYNCIKVDSISKFPSVIEFLLKENSCLKEISENSFITFNEHFHINNSYKNLSLFCSKFL